MKAIKYLEYLSKGRGRAGSAIVVDREIIEYDDVITELQAYKAKIYELKQYNSSQMCKKCAYNNANDNLKALYCNSCFRNYVDNFEELTLCK